MDRRRYFSLLTFRLLLVVLALLMAAWSANSPDGEVKPWLLTTLIAVSATLLQSLPLVVPTGAGKSAVYSLGPAFLLAGMFLLPPALLVLVVMFSLCLAGLLAGTRPYRLVFTLSISILAYVGTAMLFHLSPQASDRAAPALERSALELLIAAAAVITHLLFRSVDVRLERGVETPHWGAFQPQALVEGILCTALALSVTVLARLHIAYLGLIYVQLAATWWFLHRYRMHLRKLDARGSSATETRQMAA